MTTYHPHTVRRGDKIGVGQQLIVVTSVEGDVLTGHTDIGGATFLVTLVRVTCEDGAAPTLQRPTNDPEYVFSAFEEWDAADGPYQTVKVRTFGLNAEPEPNDWVMWLLPHTR